MQALPLSEARAVVPRAAATTLVLRDSARGPEVLMVKRSPTASFMPGAYVFPGGAVDAADAAAQCEEGAESLAARIGRVTGVGDRALGFAAAALRECEEECGLKLPGTQALQPWSRWVTPLGLHKRFDTLFFVCRAPADQVPQVDEGETTTLEWVAPQAALQARAAGSFQMEFATVNTLQSLLPFADATVQAILAHAASLSALPPIHPRVQLDNAGHIVGALLPGQPGYEALAGDGP